MAHSRYSQFLPTRLSAATTAIVSLLAWPALAQNYNQVAPQVPPVPDTPSQTDLSKAPVGQPLPNSATAVLPSLKGIVFVNGIANLQKTGIQPEAVPSGVSTGGIVLLNDKAIQDQITPYLGKPVTFDKLNEIANKVVLYYRAQHHPVVNVAIPEQDINSGVVQFVVTEFTIGQILVEGNQHYSSDLIRTQLDLQPGSTIDDRLLIDNLNQLNHNAFRHTDLVLRKSDQVGSTDLVLRTTDRIPLRVYAEYNDYGTRATGLDRWNFGVSVGNTVGNLDDLISYQFSSSDDFWHNRPNDGRLNSPSFLAHAISYSLPLDPKDTLQIYGSYAESTPRVGNALNIKGISGQASFRLQHLLSSYGNFSSAVQLGYDFKTTNNNVEFGGTQVSRNFSEIDQFSLGLLATLADDWGQTSASWNIFYSPGNLTGANKDAYFLPANGQSGTAGAKANYAYSRIELNRLTYLPHDIVWSLRVDGQVSNRSLLPSEQLAGGGIDSVRGYEEDTAIGDTGVLVRNELRAPPFSLAKRSGFEAQDEFQFLVFWDYASVSPRTLSASEPRSAQLSAIGPGIRYTLGRYLTISGDIGFRTRKVPAGTQGEAANLSVTLAY